MSHAPTHHDECDCPDCVKAAQDQQDAPGYVWLVQQALLAGILASACSLVRFGIDALVALVVCATAFILVGIVPEKALPLPVRRP